MFNVDNYGRPEVTWYQVSDSSSSQSLVCHGCCDKLIRYLGLRGEHFTYPSVTHGILATLGGGQSTLAVLHVTLPTLAEGQGALASLVSELCGPYRPFHSTSDQGHPAHPTVIRCSLPDDGGGGGHTTLLQRHDGASQGRERHPQRPLRQRHRLHPPSLHLRRPDHRWADTSLWLHCNSD